MAGAGSGTRTHTHWALVPKTSASSIPPFPHIKSDFQATSKITNPLRPVELLSLLCPWRFPVSTRSLIYVSQWRYLLNYLRCWYSKWDLNSHALAGTSFLGWGVYQFRHSSISSPLGRRAAHLFLIFILLVRAFARLVASLILKIRWGLCFTTTLTKEDWSHLQGEDIL